MMNSLRLGLALAVALALSIGGAGCDKSATGSPPKTDQTAPAPVPTPSPPTPPPAEVLAWVLPYENSLVSLQRNAKYLTIASPTYFRLAVDDKAKVAKLENWDPGAPFPRQRLPGLLNGATPAIYPLVGCIGPCGPKISRVLDDEAARKAHVADLVKAAKEQNLDGLVIDYEDVDASEGAVTAFVDELAKQLHGEKKKLVLVVQEPCGADPTCKRHPYPFALKTIIKMVDQLAIMEYDFVVDGSAPPAPKSWVDRGLKKVLSEIAADTLERYKIICAVPFYGRVTKGIADDTAVLFDEVKPTQVRSTKATVGPLTLDPEAFSKVATVTTQGPKPKSGKVFLEDRETIAARVAHMTSLNLGGIAIWRLGGEDPCMGVELAKLRKMPVPTCP